MKPLDPNTPASPSPALALIAFNRPDLLRRQLEIVRAHFRGRIFAIVDGPREGKPGEGNKVEEVVGLFEDLQDQFEVTISRAETNLGCYRRIKSGLDWVFSQVDRAIILEDDCMPSPQWFGFAAEMLERYAQDERVYSISGTNLFPHLSPPGQRYFFSRYHNCWGWATWTRAWQDFIDNTEAWQSIRTSATFRGTFRNYRSFLYWRRILDATFSGKINSWAYRWMLSCWMQSGLSIHAHVNLITNVGDDAEATRTKGSKEARRPLGRLDESLSHPVYPCVHFPYDRTFEDIVFSKSLYQRLRWLLRRFVIRFRKR
jgi:hypothetical protein